MNVVKDRLGIEWAEVSEGQWMRVSDVHAAGTRMAVPWSLLEWLHGPIAR